MQTGNLSTNPTSLPGRAVLAAVLAALSCFASAQTLPPEVQVGTRAITDFEFDWGRDGVYCPSCNGGAGNARMAYIDNNHDLWVGNVDVLSGDLVPNTGQGVLVDNNATTALEIGNGAEWMVSQRGSELVYTRWTDGQPRTPDYLNLGYARMNAGTWLSGPVDNSQLGVLPVGTLDPNDAVPEANFQAYTTSGAPQKLFWRVVSTGARNNPIPFSHEPCSPLDHRPCTPTFCSVFNHGPCVPEIFYPYGQNLQLTIETVPPDGAAAKCQKPDHDLDTIGDLFAKLRSCWEPPAADATRQGMQMSVRFSFNKAGGLIGPPRVTYATAGVPVDTRTAYLSAINTSLDACLPLKFTNNLAGALAGRPIAIRYVDNRDLGKQSGGP